MIANLLVMLPLIMGTLPVWESAPDLFDPDFDLVFEHITVDDGLPENSVRSILQDDAGFLWFGTQNGLVRYDGYEMRVYSPSSNAHLGFGGRTVMALHQDRAGTIWIGTLLRGLWRHDPRTGRFEPFDLGSELGNAIAVVDFHEDARGRLWAATGKGLVEIDPEQGIVAHHADCVVAPDADAPSPLQAALVDPRGRIWCGTDGQGLVIHEPGSEPRWFRRRPGAPGSLPNDTIYDIFQDLEGRIWIATENGLALWQEMSSSFRVFLPAGGTELREPWIFTSIAQDAQGRLWLGSSVGLTIFDPETQRFRRFAHELNREGSPVNGPVLSLLVDRSGLVWAGSWHTGLNKTDPGGALFQFRRFSMGGSSPSSASVEAVHEDRRGGFWIGLSDIPRGRGVGALLHRPHGASEYRRVPVDESEQPLRSVLCLAEDRNGGIWVGSYRGMWRVQGGTLVPASFHPEPEATLLREAVVREIAFDAEGRLWIATTNGLFLWDSAGRGLTRFAHDENDPRSIGSDNLICIHVDRRGQVWTGSDFEGLHVLRSFELGFQNFFDPSLGLETVSDIHESADGRLWLATFSGLVNFDPWNEGARLYDRAQGLPNDQVASVLEDAEGRLWLSTGFGVSLFDPEQGIFRNFDVRDGLPDNEVKFTSHLGRDGTMYLGGQGTLTHFQPWRFSSSLYVPPVVLTGLSVSDSTLIGIGGTDVSSEPLRLRYDENDLSFHFAALDFARPEQNQYRYRLEGYDKAWRTPRGGRQASYTNLPPGDFHFRVIGSNHDGLWNEAGMDLPIHIARPWWKTRIAYLAYVLAVLLFGWGVYRQLTQRARMRVRLRMQRVRAEQLQEIDELKSRFLTNITHEFRTPLTLIKAQLTRMRAPHAGEIPAGEVTARVGSALRNADRLEELIDQLLDLSRLEAGRLPVRWQYGDCVGFLRLFASAFESLAAQRAVELQVDIPESGPSAWFDADLMEKIVGNLLSNAVKFTPDRGKVRIELREGRTFDRAKVPGLGRIARKPAHGRARELVIAVTNSGTYLSAEERSKVFDRFYRASAVGGTGVGLSLVKELTEWIGGSIEVQSSLQGGTTFTVRVPVFESHPEGLEPEEAKAGFTPLGDEHWDSEESETQGGEETEELPTLLVVEDHGELRSFIREDLEGEYRVLEAEEGQSGYELAIEEIPDLVLSDVMMPGMDGFELCRRLKEDERTSHVPVILLTARSEAESRHHGLELGADDYLAKPFDLADLRLRIRNLIEQRRKLAEMYEKKLAELSPDMMPMRSSNDRFILQLRKIIDDHLGEPEFRIEELCREAGMSRSQLHRKLRGVTGMSTSEFVRTHRLQRALKLLEGGYGNVTEVAYAVGFHSLSYFSRSFRSLYGSQPSEHLHSPRVDPEPPDDFDPDPE